MNTKTIQHQLINKDIFTPNWEIKHLFLGTFNPEGGDEVAYYYGRERNKTWELLSTIFKTELNPRNSDFLTKIKNLGIACIDIISVVEVSEDIADKIIKGYKDSDLFNGKVKRKYNIDLINKVILKNPDIQIYSTWGKGSSFKKIDKYEISRINDTIPLVSPSMLAKVPKGVKKFDYMLKDWKSKIKVY